MEVEEQKDPLKQLMEKAAPLAKLYLENPEMMEKLKAASPGLSEEYLTGMLEDVITCGEKE